jgi:hypothetical protein
MPISGEKYLVEIPNGRDECIEVEPPEGYSGRPTVHRDDAFFGLSNGEEEYIDSRGTTWHIDWRGCRR